MSSDVERSAGRVAYAQAARWLETRFPAIPHGMRQVIVKSLAEIIWPYAKVAATADMATAMEPHHAAVAEALDATAHNYLTELIAEAQKGPDRE